MISDAAIDPGDGLIVDEVGRAYANSPPSYTANTVSSNTIN
jgi:hypothetical protein